MNKREIQKTLKTLRATIDKLEGQLKDEPKVKQSDNPKSYLSQDGYRYVPDPKGEYFSGYDADRDPDAFCNLALPNLYGGLAFGRPYSYRRLPKEKVYPAVDGKYYRLDRKGKYQWSSPLPGGPSAGFAFAPYLSATAHHCGRPAVGTMRFYSRTKKPNR